MNRQNILPLQLTKKDKTKDWQLEMLMEKLRSKSAQYKSIPEISKNVRMSLLEKRYASDSVEKSQHQKCLDTLQHSIKVTSLQSMVERLECLTRQLGLKFVVEPSGVFISSDMFYLEVVLDPSGAVKDVKIHHEGKKEQQSCIELVSCLSRGDFADFTAQLEGFTSVYQLNAEKKVKCKAFTALESLEADLNTLAQLQMFMIEPFNLIHKSPVGILEKRKGGHPMKLTYFVSPYDLLNTEKNEIDPIIVDNVISKNLGYSVTVCMEGSAAHKLQTTTLITVNRNINGKSTPSYTPLTSQNSAVVPACFMLKLNKPLPMCLSLVRQIQQIHPWSEIDSAPVQPLLNLIVTHCSEGKMTSSNNKGLFVTLPDQNHCYFMTENKNMNGVLVNSIPFTHPAHVPSILMILREQALFNSIIGSCVRPNSKQDFENMTMFEVSALSSTHISVSLEHPIEESMATAEIDLSDIASLSCSVSDPGAPPSMGALDAASDLGGRILNRSFSLPVTLRAIIKLWEKQSMRRGPFGGPTENFSLPLGADDPGGPNGQAKREPPGEPPAHGLMMHQQHGDATSGQNFQRFPPSDGVLANMELNNMLTDASDKLNKRQKRKLNEDVWKIGKRKVGTTERDSEPVESSSCDSASRNSTQETDAPAPADDVVEVEETVGVSITPLGIKEAVEKVAVSNSITITPIAIARPSEDRPREKKSKSRDDKSRLEKKKRKRHDDSAPMGPPDKVPLKQDANRTEASSEPTHVRSDKSSPAVTKAGQPKPTAQPSPRHSPVHVSSSPKHSSAPGGVSGKPSISALKSAAGSPSNKGGGSGGADVKAVKANLRDGSREKEKKSSSAFNANNSKTKSSSTKTKSSDANSGDSLSDGTSSPNALADPSKSNNPNQARNRKGSLSAIVDKLKVNAQHCDLATDLTGKPASGKERAGGSSAHKSGESGGKSGVAKAAGGEAKNSEYMVKPSSDGMRITINKTRSKEGGAGSKGGGSGNASKGGGVATGSPKTHTGLKPGVNSGPASKKPQQLQQKSNSTSPNMNYNNNLKNSTSVKLNSKLSSLSKPSISLKSSGATDLSKTKERIKGVNKVISSREEVDSVYKMTQSSLMEGRVKTLDKSFQIPKLSARVNDDKRLNNVNHKAKNDVAALTKYPLTVLSSGGENKSRGGANSVLHVDDETKDSPQNLSSFRGKEDVTKPPPPSKPPFLSSDPAAVDLAGASKFPPAPDSVSVRIVGSPGAPIGVAITEDGLPDGAALGLGK